MTVFCPSCLCILMSLLFFIIVLCVVITKLIGLILKISWESILKQPFRWSCRSISRSFHNSVSISLFSLERGYYLSLHASLIF
jgi:hypothetical protein